MRDSPVIVAAVRTPLGRKHGGLATVHPTRLLGAALRAVMERAAVDPGDVAQVIGGIVAQVGEQSFDATRTAWLAEGFPDTVPATTVDAQCGSSQQALTLAAGLIGSGLGDVAIACGVESMSRLPIGSNFRKDFGLGRPVPKAYRDHYEFINQFEAAERIAVKYSITREDADELGARSQNLAARAWAEGRYDAQLVNVDVLSEEGQTVTLERDECLRETNIDDLSALTAVLPNGIHTAGTSSQISDGASAVLMMSERRAAELGLRPLARIVDSIVVGVDPVMMLLGPHEASPRILARTGLSIDDIDLIEINEAFASIVLSFEQELNVDPVRINPNGGAIALGHPLGATGTVLITKAVHQLQETGGRYALVTMCCGGGLGTATVLERM
ncbi:MAG: acetyl-CoA C-acetyltransferase [Ilumatobacteraceae bacterium]|jgi:acetyl-CoA C-acetyltransferase